MARHCAIETDGVGSQNLDGRSFLATTLAIARTGINLNVGKCIAKNEIFNISQKIRNKIFSQTLDTLRRLSRPPVGILWYKHLNTGIVCVYEVRLHAEFQCTKPDCGGT